MKQVYSGNPKIVGYSLIITVLFFLGVTWLWNHTEEPLTPKELWQIEEIQREIK